MAKRRSAAKGRESAADRAAGAAGRRRKATATAERGAAVSGEPQERQQMRERQQMGRGGRRRGGLLSSARDMAQTVGQTTIEAAQSTVGAARGLASGAADAAGTVAGKVRENPWPSLLIGAGATWLAIDAVRGRSAESPRDRSEDRGRRGATKGRGQERGGVSQAMSKVAEVGRSAGEQIEEFVRERPLLAGAATLGLGMAVGMALPSTLAENEVLGQARDTVVRRAKDAAHETMEKVHDVAESLERIGPFASSRRGSRG